MKGKNANYYNAAGSADRAAPAIRDCVFLCYIERECNLIRKSAMFYCVLAADGVGGGKEFEWFCVVIIALNV